MSLNEVTENGTKISPDIFELLEEAGLTRREIEIYEYLLSTGGAMPSSIARDTGQPRGRIYEGMRNLVSKGFARERPTRPILFCPTPLPDVLAAAQARLSRHLTAIRQAQARNPTRTPAEGDLPPAIPMRMRDVSVLSGRRACHAEITRMLENATEFFWISGGGHFADRLANMPNFLENAQAAAARGVSVKIIFPKAGPIGRALAAVDADGARSILLQVPRDEAGPMVSCASELASLEMVAQPDDDAPTRGDDVAIHIADALFAKRLKRRLDRLVGTVVAETHLPSTFPWLGPNHGAEIFADAVRHANTQVQVLGPPEWAAHMRTTWAKDAPVYADAVKRGVQLRVLATHDAASQADLDLFSSSWTIRQTDQVPMWLTIVDGIELYQAFPPPSPGGVPQFRRSEEAHEIRFYQGTFERIWDHATENAAAAPMTTPTPKKAES